MAPQAGSVSRVPAEMSRPREPSCWPDPTAGVSFAIFVRSLVTSAHGVTGGTGIARRSAVLWPVDEPYARPDGAISRLLEGADLMATVKLPIESVRVEK